MNNDNIPLTNNFNPIWPGTTSEISHATEGFCAYLKK